MAQWLQALPGRSVAIATSDRTFEGLILKPTQAVKFDPANARHLAIQSDIIARGSSVVGAQIVTSSFDPTPAPVWPRPGEVAS